MRPRQWSKNAFVLGGLIFSGSALHVQPELRAWTTFVAFCLMSGATYLLNDAVDAEADRLHPVKSARPVASGLLPVPAAIATAAVLMSAALGLSAVVGLKLLVAMAAYVAIPALGYSLWFKHEPVFDMGAVASGFIVRAIAGGVATGVPLSNWFLIVASCG